MKWEYLIASFLFIVGLGILIAFSLPSRNEQVIQVGGNLEGTKPKQTSAPTLNAGASPSEQVAVQTDAPRESGNIQAASPAPTLTIKADADNKININTADMETLMTLPGIGEVKAKAIIEYRNNSGPFQNVDALNNVKGIGDKTLEKLRDLVVVTD